MVKPVLGYAARILMMIGTAGFASIVTGEMLASQLVLDGVGSAAPISLWTNLFMGPVAVAVRPALVAFFVGGDSHGARAVQPHREYRRVVRKHRTGVGISRGPALMEAS